VRTLCAQQRWRRPVPTLADLQGGVRQALLTGEAVLPEALLVGGRDGRKRLAIHQRHYATSLITSLLDRFPATVWLVGSAFVMDAARQFVRDHPPTRPCIAEYGEEFPAFLAKSPGAAEIPYLRQFGELEWHLSRLSLAVDVPPLTPADLALVETAALADAPLTLQPGVHYMGTDWAIDELMSLYLADSAPDQFALQPGTVWIELRGVRGELTMNRLDHVDFVFRSALAAGKALGDAAVSALEIDERFDAGQALIALLGEELVAAIDVPNEEGAA
jgi:hypothetical protein